MDMSNTVVEPCGVQVADHYPGPIVHTRRLGGEHSTMT
jgi:hypothetical protein